jgi:hypothetical protein
MILYSLIALAVVILAIVLTEAECWGWATITLVGSVVAAHYAGLADVLTFLRTHMVETALYALGYVAVGVLWSFIKWFSFLHRSRDDLRERKDKLRAHYEKHIKSPQFSRTTKEMIEGEMVDVPVPVPTFEEYLRDYGANLKRPTAADNKGRIIGWMAFWPFSVVGTFLNDPVRRLFNFLFRHFKTLYQKMADHVFRNDADLA